MGASIRNSIDYSGKASFGPVRPLNSQDECLNH